MVSLSLSLSLSRLFQPGREIQRLLASRHSQPSPAQPSPAQLIPAQPASRGCGVVFAKSKPPSDRISLYFLWELGEAYLVPKCFAALTTNPLKIITPTAGYLSAIFPTEFSSAGRVREIAAYSTEIRPGVSPLSDDRYRRRARSSLSSRWKLSSSRRTTIVTMPDWLVDFCGLEDFRGFWSMPDQALSYSTRHGHDRSRRSHVRFEKVKSQS